MANMDDLRFANRMISNDLIMFKYERYFEEDDVLTVELKWFNIGHLGRREFLDAIKPDIARYYSLYGNCIGPCTSNVSYKSRFNPCVVFVEWGVVHVFKLGLCDEDKMYGMDAIVKGLDNGEILNQINVNVRFNQFNFDPTDDVGVDDERIDPDDDEIGSFQVVIDFEYSELVSNCLNDVVYEANKLMHKRIHKRIFQDEIQYELKAVAWYPDRVLDWCLDFEESKDLKERWGVGC